MIHSAKRWFGIAAEISSGQNGTQISIPLASPVEFLLELLGHAAEFSHERMVLHADELSCEIQSETLYEALCSLPEAQRKVLLLGFWGGFGDEEIARRLSVTPRTVYNLRQRAFKVVKAFYEQKRAPP